MDEVEERENMVERVCDVSTSKKIRRVMYSSLLTMHWWVEKVGHENEDCGTHNVHLSTDKNAHT